MTVWVVIYISIDRSHIQLEATLVENTDPTPDPTPTPAAAQPVYVDSLEERAAKSWKVSSDNPDNYLTKFWDASGKKLVSGVPTINNCNGGANIVVPLSLEESEKIFEKSKSENEIVVSMDDDRVIIRTS